ncbi:GntR family transcriptional regulator [Brevibacterium ammoniilyticum]|uniref:GntR family transcriptional regulator n=1 Tax=Brevibacterium ammoniilyticum TaxID=1046555 RepID=A0ABP9U535_9MICO
MDRARPAAPPSLREHALSIIRDAIATGELDEERIYSAAGLAKQLGISLSPVREAMMALVTEGTVEAVPNRGFRLVPITEADLEEIIRIRVLLAVPAVRELCRQAGEETGTGAGAGADSEPRTDSEPRAAHADIAERLRLLRSHAEATVGAAETGDIVGFYTHDRRFHESLLAFGLGPRAAEISLRLRDQSRIGGGAAVTGAAVGTVAVASAKELIDIVDLIEAGAGDEVAELVTRNLYFFKRTEG